MSFTNHWPANKTHCFKHACQLESLLFTPVAMSTYYMKLKYAPDDLINTASSDWSRISSFPQCCRSHILAPCCPNRCGRTSLRLPQLQSWKIRSSNQAVHSNPENAIRIGMRDSHGRRTCSLGISDTAYGLLGCTPGDVTDGHPFCGEGQWYIDDHYRMDEPRSGIFSFLHHCQGT